jgi:hypothetical protein
MLLAISTILQGQRTPGELTELLSNIGTDIRKDGILTSSGSGSALMNAAVLLNLTMVRSNLSRRYEALGMTALVGDFEKYVRAFINSKKYPFTDVISYPTTGASGPNLLDPSTTTFPFGYSGVGAISANLPRGTSLLVVLSLASGECMGLHAWVMLESNHLRFQ